MRRLMVTAVLAVGGLAVILAASAAFAGDGNGGHFKARLNGYQEVVGGPGPESTGSVSTMARGEFTARREGNTLEYRLSYRGIEGGTASQAHLHFAQRHVGGGVIAFLCGGGGKPACPTPSGTVEGTISAADVIGPAAQGIQAGAFDELLRALRAGAVYANVHSTPSYPEGEIRGQVGRGRGDKDD